MDQTTILLPFVGMLLLTFVVWVHMYVRRLTFIVAKRVDPQRLTTPEKASKIIPEAIHRPAHNLRNLFELPVVFYAICLYLFVTGTVDAGYVAAAWLFVSFRTIHSLVHCTMNVVKARFASYMLASFALWFMVIRAALDLLLRAS